ncbi:sigma 54-interacting transcriptional regulator [Altererythrobacter sp. KTW20L]|uniref:sigma-54 interaction domain-containing protein n=1 Tax=Altererythrobacter sp. KTW20L TaxID=2942210 RepID=UPI0020C16E80|nr:sigma 54-interacting transcriptional regulator [Altererythrobacter sp. KTW20L]MCL6252172.1 sigma 54-interacting transcriptional regulator [Altererythrobacter sp. KTW20L]
MARISVARGLEKNHAGLANYAAALLAGSGKGGEVLLCAEGSELPARRRDDRLVLLARGDAPALELAGSGAVRLTYADDTSPAVRAALLASATRQGEPVAADTGSLAMLALAARVAASDIPVLVEGPTGTGKEVLARFIHANSARSAGPFVALNCAAMPEAMLEAMLFGHKKGAFTGATEAAEGFFRAADGGTLLLDELGEMPIGLQAKLLRALQEGEVVPLGATQPVKVDVRIIACTNRDLATEIAAGRFREDLYYRLNVFPLRLEALRERAADVAPLAFTMLLRHAGPTIPWIADEALAKLAAHAWPGNVRELENVIRRALLLAGDETTITTAHVVFDSAVRPVGVGDSLVAPVPPATPDGHNLSTIVRRSEAQVILDTLDRNDGNRLATAAALGISERTLRYRLASMREAGLVAAGGAR